MRIYNINMYTETQQHSIDCILQVCQEIHSQPPITHVIYAIYVI